MNLELYKSAIKYLRARKNSWSKSTYRSERHRIKVLVRVMQESGEEPGKVFHALSTSLSPYSSVTYYTRLVSWMTWANRPEFKKWREENRNFFKHAYTKNPAKISFQEALKRIDLMSEGTAKEAAKLLLVTGMRSCEIATFDGLKVVGKGGKTRKVYTNKKPVDISYEKLYYELKKVGLKPHELRKVYASTIAKKHANGFELCEIMGWSSIQTATFYIGNESKAISSLAYIDIDTGNSDNRRNKV